MAATPVAIFHFCLAFLIIFANITVSVALRFMRSAKRTTVVFLADLAVCNLVQGIVFLIKAVFYIWHANTALGCVVITMISLVSTGSYITGIFYVYLDLYLSLKRMSIGKAVISTRFAIQLVVLSWIIWLGIAAIGYGMRSKGYVYNHSVGCSVTNGSFTKEYLLLISLVFIFCITVVIVFHALTYRLIKRARTTEERCQDPECSNGVRISAVSTPAAAAAHSQERKAETRKSKWLKKNDAILKMILVVLLMFLICWYPLIIITIAVAYCRPCTAYITPEVVYFTYVLVVIQYNSNGVIYLIKIREFQNACKRLCCKCCPWHRRIAIVDSEFSATMSVQD